MLFGLFFKLSMKKFCFWVSLFFILVLNVSCGYSKDSRIVLDSNWEYSIDTIVKNYTPIDISQFSKIAKLCPERKGDIYLKNRFTIPKDLPSEYDGIIFINYGTYRIKAFYVKEPKTQKDILKVYKDVTPEDCKLTAKWYNDVLIKRIDERIKNKEYKSLNDK